MKLTIVAWLLLLSGILNVIGETRSIGGVVCAVVGILILLIKMLSAKANESNGTNYDQKAQNQYMVEQASRADAWYNSVMNKHYDLSQRIGVAYTVANNQNDPFCEKMIRVIEMCKEDVAMAEQFKNAYLAKRDADIKAGYYTERDVTTKPPTYESFKRLAIIYEKQKDYDNAILICTRAIQLGFSDDGTTGQMEGRIARLKNRKQKQEIKAKEPVMEKEIQSAVDSFFEE